LDDLILRFLNGDATPSEEERVGRWRAESRENETYFRDFAAIWGATAPGFDEQPAVPVDPVIVIAEAERRRASGGKDRVFPFRRRGASGGRGRSRVAGGFAIAAGLAAVAVSVRLVTSGPAPGSTANFAAGPSETRTVVLEDGSFARLAPGSAIAVAAAGGVRQVRLSGRAFFAVAPDAERPFVVRVGGTETRVLGTRFEVAETEGGVRTVVVDGIVRVSNVQGAVEAAAGDVATSDSGRPPTVTHADDVRALLDWPGGLLLFQGTPLERVAQEVERAFGRSVTVETYALRALRISGSFQDEGFEDVVQGLCDASGALCRIGADGAVLSPAVTSTPR